MRLFYSAKLPRSDESDVPKHLAHFHGCFGQVLDSSDLDQREALDVQENKVAVNKCFCKLCKKSVSVRSLHILIDK